MHQTTRLTQSTLLLLGRRPVTADVLMIQSFFTVFPLGINFPFHGVPKAAVFARQAYRRLHLATHAESVQPRPHAAIPRLHHPLYP